MICTQVVFWEGANADLSARAGGDFADLEVSAPEDWLRKPSSISLFPSGRCAATRAYLAAEIAKRVEDRSTRVDALRSGDAALSASDSARLIVDKWLRFCDAAAERVDARRREVTAALAVRTAPAPLMRVPRPASAAVDIGAIAAAAVPRLRPKTAPVPRQVVSRRPAPRKPAPAPDGAWPLPHLLRPRVARHREAMESLRRTYRCP